MTELDIKEKHGGIFGISRVSGGDRSFHGSGEKSAFDTIVPRGVGWAGLQERSGWLRGQHRTPVTQGLGGQRLLQTSVYAKGPGHNMFD